jgi:hypothetical protein
MGKLYKEQVPGIVEAVEAMSHSRQ